MATQRKYAVVSAEETAQQEEKQKQAANPGCVQLPDGFKFFRLPKDVKFIHVDIIPFLMETANGLQPLPRYNFYIHRMGKEGGYQMLICPQQQYGKPCPICEYTRTLDWNNQEEQKIRQSLRVQERQLYLVIPHEGDADTKGKIFVFDTPRFGLGKLIDEKINARDKTDPNEAAWGNYADLLEGWRLKLNLGDVQLGAGSYWTVTSIDFKPRSQQYSEDMYDKVPDLSKCLNPMEYEDICKVWKSPKSQSQQNAATVAAATESFDIESGHSPMVSAGNGDDSEVPF